MRVIRSTALACALAAMLLAAPARAADPAAQAVFDEGLRLFEAGDYAAACPKLATAVELSSGGGVGGMLLLAECRERLGQVASAWAIYRIVVARATQSGQEERRAQAEAGVARLEPRLHRLRLALGPSVVAIPGLVVRQGGQVVPREAWAVPTPVDPGTVVVRLEAPGHLPLERTVEVAKAAGETPLVIDALQPAPAPSPGSGSGAENAGGRTGTGDAERSLLGARGFVGIGLGGLGVATMGASIAVALAGKSKYDDAAAGCVAGICDAADVEASEDGRSLGDVGTVLFVGGAALTAAGVTLLVLDLAEGSGSAGGGEAATGARLVVRPGSFSAQGTF